MKKLTSTITIALFALCSFAQSSKEIDLKKVFENYEVDGCIVIFDESKNTFLRYNTNLCDSTYIPGSTFDILNAAIALEEGIVLDANQEILWDGNEWRQKTWNKDQTLKTAMKSSCAWVFSNFVSQIGYDRYYTYLNELNYGNKNIEGVINLFWISSKLRISANEQVAFLRKFYNNDLGIQKRNIDIVKNLIIVEKNEKYTISAKSGVGEANHESNILWKIGYINVGEKVYYFALNAIAPKGYMGNEARKYILKDILTQLKIVE